jgi:transcriptional regulator with XRE-family HTH domain
MDFAEFLKREMETQGFRTQREFADSLGVSYSNLSGWLSGKDPRLSTVLPVLEQLQPGIVRENHEEYEPRASPPTLADLKACLTGLGLSDGDIDFIMDSVAVRIDKRRRKGQGRAATA